MNGIKYYTLGENEDVPYEFVVIRNVNGEPEFCASFVNTNSLAFENGVLLKLHQRNDELRAENAKLRELAVLNWEWAHSCCGNNCKMQTNDCGYQIDRECNYEREIWDRMRELGVEVE